MTCATRSNRFARSSEPCAAPSASRTTCQSTSSSAAFALSCFSSNWSNEVRSRAGNRRRRACSQAIISLGRMVRTRNAPSRSAYRSLSSNWRRSASTGLTALRGRLDPFDEPDPVVNNRDEPDVNCGPSSGRRYVVVVASQVTSRPAPRSIKTSSGLSGKGSASGYRAAILARMPWGSNRSLRRSRSLTSSPVKAPRPRWRARRASMFRGYSSCRDETAVRSLAAAARRMILTLFGGAHSGGYSGCVTA